MNNVGINTSAFANFVTPFSPVGKQAVGFENTETKVQVLPPVEQSPSNAATDKRALENDLASADVEQQQLEEQTEKRDQQQQNQQDREQVQELAVRDREVRAHEQAHAAVGGQYAGSASFTYQRGPDGVNYAVGGEVPISLPSGGGDPQSALAAAVQVQRAALAPADPSAQDRRVAAQANQVATEARGQIAAQQVASSSSESTETEEVSSDEEPLNDQQAKEQKLEQQQEQEARKQRLADLQAVAFRSVQLGEQLITLNSLERDKNVGSVLDQLA